MPESADQSPPGEDYFNDLTQQIASTRPDEERRGSQEDESGQVPKIKRIACVLCRKRKLKCDGQRPSCATCTRLQHDCSYDEVRRKSGPKRGYVKALEARLAQVETLLKTQDETPAASNQDSNGRRGNGISVESIQASGLRQLPQSTSRPDITAQATEPPLSQGMLGADPCANANIELNEPFPWEMIGLGLDEPLPNQDVIDELNEIYFRKVHPSLPVLHRPRYYAAMNLAPHMRPPVCMRYAMWCSAASVSDKYEALQEHFYARARRYIQNDELKGHGESMITISHCQTWILLAAYEFKLMYFPRAWMSAGRASRLAQMMGLHRLDGNGLEVKQCLPPARDWTEREERRRTFWMAFCIDRYASIGTGWPMTFEEKDINNMLPCDDESYELNKPTKTIFMAEALDPSGSYNLSSFAGVCLMACLFGRNLTHLHRPDPDDHDEDLNGEFWKRHRQLDNILLNNSLSLPDHLRLPSGLNNPNVVFMNMNIHTSTICLHQAAIFKADKNRMPGRISAESKVRCLTAAAEIASIMRQISHLDLSAMNPFISFCLYVAARVFVQYLKSRPRDAQVKGSLQFLLSAMNAIKRKNPLTESFLVQLDVDLEGAGLEDSSTLRAAMPSNMNSRSPASPSGLVAPSSTALPSKTIPTYGDNGLTAFTNPNQGGVATSYANNSGPDITFPTSQLFPTTTQPTLDDASQFFSMQMELPNRPRSPGSSRSPASYQMPTLDPEMDTSPDVSGGADNRTPPSTHVASSRTSNTSYSPQNLQQSDQQQSNEMFDTTTSQTVFGGGGGNFHLPNLSTPTAERPAHGGIMSFNNWSGTSPPALTPGATAGLDMAAMTDAEWNQVMETFGWESNLMMSHDTSMQDMLASARHVR